ncbi:MAG: nucleotidyltransferase family protein [Rikenellaceae bacterium]
MNRSQEQLLELTRCALWSKELSIQLFEEECDWAEVLQLAKEQTLLGVVSSAIERLPMSLHPSRSERLRLHQQLTLNRQYRSHHVEVLSKLLELVARAGVERPVLLKGLGVGLNYPDPSVRQCGDIDLYVGDRYYSKVREFLCDELGFEIDNTNVIQHFSFDFIETHIEIHRYATSPRGVAFRSREFTEWSVSQLEGEELRRVSIDGVMVYLPPYNFDFIFIFYHAWRHFLSGGVGLRQLCDWCCFINSFCDKLDVKELDRLIKRFKLRIPISLFATICVKELGVSSDLFRENISTTMPQYKKVLDKIWIGGNFGYYASREVKKSRTLFERKCNSFVSHLQKMKFLFDLDWKYSIGYYIPFFVMRTIHAVKHYKKLGDTL